MNQECHAVAVSDAGTPREWRIKNCHENLECSMNQECHRYSVPWHTGDKSDILAPTYVSKKPISLPDSRPESFFVAATEFLCTDITYVGENRMIDTDFPLRKCFPIKRCFLISNVVTKALISDPILPTGTNHEMRWIFKAAFEGLVAVWPQKILHKSYVWSSLTRFDSKSQLPFFKKTIFRKVPGTQNLLL